MTGCHSKCLHRQSVLEYYDARDAVDALRETGDQMQMEDDEFEEKFPQINFKEWLLGLARHKEE